MTEERKLPPAGADPPRERKPVAVQGHGVLILVGAGQQVGKVVVGAQRSRGLVVLERNLEGVLQERRSLQRTPARGQDQRLRVQRLREHLGKPERLGHAERVLDPLGAGIGMSGEEQEASELRREPRKILVGFLGRQQFERALHHLEPVLQTPAVPH